ncbi:efflux transporter, outer membrane factor (OMF) lipoprotein, NodT family [Dokdonella immobilis]|uniref:Efflux transporter, outer membrane factor (OMF) lipoprotein, NodT family n=1 Tax=Dokdonella immobilis TaxID=578942 RepID=A0A1I4XUL2_9GAMM|nr:efflux transporter, outer membrane factor (OMF) lipoprotein, NodT family [Dokdonella immobilis]
MNVQPFREPDGRSRPRGAPVRPSLVACSVGLALVLAGCAAGPDFRAPTLADEAGYRATALPASTASTDGPTGDAQRFLEGEQVPALWWTGFGSEELNRRVTEALANSPTVASAQAALRKAQEEAGVARGQLFPSLDAALGANRQKSPVATGGGFSTSPYTVYNASVDIGYTLDLFGGIRRGVEAQRALADYQQFQLEGTYLSLASNVVTTSILEASLREQIRATEEIVEAYRQQYDLVDKQFATGAKSQGDVLLAQSQVATARAGLPALRKALERSRTQLAVYLGRFPSQAELEALDLDALTLPGEVPVSLPSVLVRQRPDIRAAEARLHEATARVGVATANLFPNIGLSASFGSQALDRGDLFGSSAEAWSLGLNLLQPIFRGGSLRAQKRAAQAGLDQAAADYRTTVLTAFQNVADSLRALELDAESLASQSAAQEATSNSLALTRRQYEDGSVAYLQVLDATRLYQQTRLAVIDARATRLADTAALYAALGGGFADAGDAPAPAEAQTAR